MIKSTITECRNPSFAVSSGPEIVRVLLFFHFFSCHSFIPSLSLLFFSLSFRGGRRMSDTNGGAGSPGLTVKLITELFTVGGTPTTTVVPPSSVVTQFTAVNGEVFRVTSVRDARTSVFTTDETISTQVFTITLGRPSTTVSSTQPVLVIPQTESPVATQSSQVGTTKQHAPVGEIVIAILGTVFLLSLVVAGLLIRRRRAQRRNNHPHALGPSRMEAAIVDDVVERDDEKTRPHPLVLYENEKARPFGEGASSSSAGTDGEKDPMAALPTAAKLTFASMADEMQALRDQVYQLELERNEGRPPTDELPPQYAPR
ncbi:hypothetical protein MVEN_01391700 [Mycena venus]|uniref:Transmembrane protein n=1 Tax=Mycena venus TaxID=2733690 RepID=A0A8H6XYQ6_9AGAR|nr:hypothetical protein MVEN_01391700 [Mycena venus]